MWLLNCELFGQVEQVSGQELRKGADGVVGPVQAEIMGEEGGGIVIHPGSRRIDARMRNSLAYSRDEYISWLKNNDTSK